MGEFADMAYDLAFDMMLDGEDGPGYFGDYDTYYTPRTCYRCGKSGLTWATKNGQFRLFDNKINDFHICWKSTQASVRERIRKKMNRRKL